MSISRTISKATPATGNYEVALTVSALNSWKIKSAIIVTCDDCKGTKKNLFGGSCGRCHGKGKISPYISSHVKGKSTHVVRFSFKHEELAFALSGGTEAEYRLILAKYVTQSKTDLLLLYKEVIKKANEMALMNDWPKKKTFNQETLERAAITAIDELIDNRLCKTCNGAGTIYIHEEGKGVQKYTCDAEGCFGSGYKVWEDRRRARSLGMVHTTFSRGVWKKYYMRLFSYDRLLEQMALSRIYWRTR